MTASALAVEGLRCSFGSHVALDDLQLDVRDGEFLTLLGPSGCGKTTFLRVIAGFERPDAGSVAVRGKGILRLPPEQRPVNLVFQRYALFPHLDVWGNVAFGLQVSGENRRGVDKRTAEAIEMVRLGGLERRRTDQLSGGQQQRVALARAIVNRPPILLLDEPLGALDLQLRKEMQLELRSLHRALGSTFIYVTHDQEEALVMSDRIVVMRDGRIEQDGPAREVYLRPCNRFVASFIGETNLLEASVRDGMLELDGLDVSVPASEQPSAPRVTLSVRPEHLSLAGGDHAHLQGVVDDSIFVGSVIRHVLRLKSGATLLAQEQPGRGRLLERGDRVGVSWRPADAVVLER